MIETIILSMTSFVGTNIDDMFINALFYADAEGREDDRRIVIGKYAGIGLLVLLSFVGAFGLKFLPLEYLSWLGIVPLLLGVKELIAVIRDRDETAEGQGFRDEEKDNRQKPKAQGLLWNVIVITIANGADNIGVYIPLFTSMTGWQYFVFIVVFVIMTGIWCVLGRKMVQLPLLNRFLTKYKGILVPVVYIALGLYILLV